MFNKILIANRGEIACRVIRTAKRLGISCVAVYSTNDANALHVKLADEAYLLGPAPSRESYLNSAKILQIAKQAGVAAIHPGYGFLSENAEFAEACAAAGICFIGPSADVIRLMGLKNAAKQHMQQAGVPVIPGYHDTEQSLAVLQQAAEHIGYPLLIKAAAGGGGKGMRLVQQPQEFAAALAAVQREAKASFADDHVLLEKYLQYPRHIEVQILADLHGNTVHIFERDCSIQRRHQKVIEETPAPHLAESLREKICAAAVAAAKAVGYVNAGTVEMLLDDKQNFYFMEMNTRLQVEHPITEMISGLDLVEWQLRIAAGEPLAFNQAEIKPSGHALEARIYAEDPQQHFLPATGKIIYLATPAISDHLRIDSGIQQDDTIGVHYDPLLAKLSVWDATREAAVQRLQHALQRYHCVGVTTNLALLQAITHHPKFKKGGVNTFFIEQFASQLLAEQTQIDGQLLALASLFVLLQTNFGKLQPKQPLSENSPWQLRDAWRLNAQAQHSLHFYDTTTTFKVVATYQEQANFLLDWQGQQYHATGYLANEHSLQATINNHSLQAIVIPHKNTLHIFAAEKHAVLHLGLLPKLVHATEEIITSLVSPMPGVIAAIKVTVGEKVKQGDSLLVMEAMKMEHTLQAPRQAIVSAIHCQEGDTVAEGIELLVLDAQTS